MSGKINEKNADGLELVVIHGVEGPSVYLNDYRIASNKPWGGGTVIHRFVVRWKDILFAVKNLKREGEKLNIEKLEMIKSAATKALSGRKKLKKMHDDFTTSPMTRARTTTYNARCGDIIDNIVKPNEQILKNLL